MNSNSNSLLLTSNSSSSNNSSNNKLASHANVLQSLANSIDNVENNCLPQQNGTFDRAHSAVSSTLSSSSSSSLSPKKSSNLFDFHTNNPSSHSSANNEDILTLGNVNNSTFKSDYFAQNLNAQAGSNYQPHASQYLLNNNSITNSFYDTALRSSFPLYNSSHNFLPRSPKNSSYSNSATSQLVPSIGHQNAHAKSFPNSNGSFL